MKMKMIFFLAMLYSIVSFSQGIEFSELVNWSGNGSKVAMCIIDFNDGSEYECFAFGYRFDGDKTTEDMLNEIAIANTNFSIVATGGFLMDITYKTHAGIGGEPNYWSTLVFQNDEWVANWDGIAEALTDSMIFGLSYTDWYEAPDENWYPIHLPSDPIPALESTVGVTSVLLIDVNVFPNPATHSVTITSDMLMHAVELYSLSGVLTDRVLLNATKGQIDISAYPSGLYICKVIYLNEQSNKTVLVIQ